MRAKPKRHKVTRNGKTFWRGKGTAPAMRKSGEEKSEYIDRMHHDPTDKWHPDQFGGDKDHEGAGNNPHEDTQTIDSGVWKLKAGQHIGYKNENTGKVEKAQVHGFGPEGGGKGRRHLHISTKKGHLHIDPYTNGHTIVDAPKQKKK